MLPSPVRLTMRPRCSDGRVNEIAAECPEARQGALFVRAGEPAVTNNVGHQDRCQFSCLGHLRLSGPQATVAQSAVQAAEKGGL
jgi:hypothetical protein